MDTSADAELNSAKLRVWLWIAVVAAVIGAVMLYPIGPALWNKIFILIKIGMVSGLLMLLIGRHRSGYFFWSAFSLLAVLMTLLKRYYTGHMEGIFILAILTDVLMPGVAYLIYRHESGRNQHGHQEKSAADQSAKGE